MKKGYVKEKFEFFSTDREQGKPKGSLNYYRRTDRGLTRRNQRITTLLNTHIL